MNSRAFDYFDRRWKRGIPVEDSCRRWAWESYHSELNQLGSITFPAPPIAAALGLRLAGGSSDMIDDRGYLATIYREAPGPAFGSHFLYMRWDLVQKYCNNRGLRFLQAVSGERTVAHRLFERSHSDSLRSAFQTHRNRFGTVVGLDD